MDAKKARELARCAEDSAPENDYKEVIAEIERAASNGMRSVTCGPYCRAWTKKENMSQIKRRLENDGYDVEIETHLEGEAGYTTLMHVKW